MAEEAGVQTTDTQTVDTGAVATETTTTETDTGATATETVTEGGDTTAGEGSQTTPSFSKDDIDWGESLSGLSDEEKDAHFKQYSSWFKDKEAANAFIKSADEALRAQKEQRAKQVAELEAGWEKDLKTDADFGKDYDGNKKTVKDTFSKYASESEMAELEKFGFLKSPVLNRVMLKIAREFSDAKVAGVGQPVQNKSTQPVNRFGETMFDFTKKAS